MKTLYLAVVACLLLGGVSAHAHDLSRRQSPNGVPVRLPPHGGRPVRQRERPERNCLRNGESLAHRRAKEASCSNARTVRE